MPSPRSTRRLGGLAVLLAVCAAPRLLAAQDRPAPAAPAAAGTVAGTAVRAEDGAPVAFALVRLLRAPVGDAPPPVVQQAITNANGRFHFAGVGPGTYVLQLARIGYRPVLSAPLDVRAGASVQHVLRAPDQVLQLAAITVRPGDACLVAERLADEPRLAGLWAEARKGVEVRRAFERQYRFAYTLRQDITLHRRLRSPARYAEVDTITSEPDSAAARERRRAARLRAEGYATGNRIVLPDERYLLDDAFLQDHCLETAVAEADGALGLRFRPVARRGGPVDIRGTIWIGAADYQMRRIEFEYLDDGEPYGRSRIDYADRPIGGSVLRLRTGGDGTLRIRGAAAALVGRADATFTYTYHDANRADDR